MRKRVPREPRESIIYIFTNPAWHEWVKVGQTDRPTQRLHALSVGCPDKRDYYKMEIVAKGDRRLEQFVHSVLQHLGHRPMDDIRGEWFTCTTEIAREAILVCAGHVAIHGVRGTQNPGRQADVERCAAVVSLRHPAPPPPVRRGRKPKRRWSPPVPVGPRYARCVTPQGA